MHAAAIRSCFSLLLGQTAILEKEKGGDLASEIKERRGHLRGRLLRSGVVPLAVPTTFQSRHDA